MTARIEHANITVSDPDATAAWMCKLFGWHVRWKGEGMLGGYTVHVGTDDSYLALYRPDEPVKRRDKRYDRIGGFNHAGFVVDDLDSIEKQLRAKGFEIGTHHDYEPGRRFYFFDDDGLEYEAVQYD